MEVLERRPELNERRSKDSRPRIRQTEEKNSKADDKNVGHVREHSQATEGENANMKCGPPDFIDAEHVSNSHHIFAVHSTIYLHCRNTHLIHERLLYKCIS